MIGLFQKLWEDDKGAVISVEWILFVAILIFGLVPGLVAVRNSVDAAMATIGNVLTSLVPNFTYSGFGVTGQGGNPEAAVGGYETTNSTSNQWQSFAVTPMASVILVVDPSP